MNSNAPNSPPNSSASDTTLLNDIDPNDYYEFNSTKLPDPASTSPRKHRRSLSLITVKSSVTHIKRWLYIVVFATVATILIVFASISESRKKTNTITVATNITLAQETHRLDPSAVLLGPPTKFFRDNLRPEVQYISSWISAGWTNDVMTYGNLIYLGLITDRVPIIPMFTPSHVGGDVSPILFSEVFDLPRLRTAIGKPILEWKEVKQEGSDALEPLGCWNIWESLQDFEPNPRMSVVPGHLNLDVSYTKAPSWIKLIPNYVHDKCATFWSLASLAYSQMRGASLVTPLPSPKLNLSLPPDEHLLCFDFLYYVVAQHPGEWEYDFGPAWRYVGQHMHWNKTLENLADTYIRRAIGIIDPTDPVPPFITVHVRRSDFVNMCQDEPASSCFAPISAYAQRVQEVQDELLQRRGTEIKHVIVLSDERDESWWDEIREHGWITIDHSKTAEQHGRWYPVLIDAVIQSSGQGFVGTDRSTMSTLARRRVESWHSGVSRTVKWGHPGSDDH